jgi:acyl-CoA reductase-like NAD-dependent aldehyde dehydrogenase
MSTATVAEWPCLVGGRRVETGAWHDVTSPYDGRVVSRVAWGDAALAAEALGAAKAAMRAPLTGEERERILRAASALVDAHAEELAGLICAEGGKPLKTARLEAARAARTLALSATEAGRIHGEQVPIAAGVPGRGPFAITVRKPIGVVAAITPFNFPLNLVAHKIGPALAAGCAVVLKPADKTPGPAVRLAELLAEAGLPDGWLNVVVGPPGELVDVLLEDPAVRLVSFTGSAAIGWDLASRGARKHVKLELGNVTPAIVEADADLEDAATKLAAGAFVGSGQVCVSVQRIYVQRSVHEAFTAALLRRVAALRTGDPADEETDVGPLITPEATDRLRGWIDDATSRGGRVLAGGEVVDGVLAPTVLADVPADASIACREAFGPVVCVWPYDDVDDALAAANATDHGLQVGLFTRDLATIMRAAAVVDYAALIVNDSPTFRADEMPYGGMKESGNTREGPAYAVREMTEECLVVLNA